MSSIIVQKYGGACLETPEKVRAVAAEIARLHATGARLVVIVSAMGKSTDELVRLAYGISSNPNRRELDMLLSTGERVSMALMSMALSDLGVPAISFTGSQAGVMTDGSHSAARIVDVKPIRVREELQRGRVVVLAGFQGVNPQSKEITTLGRGGSDVTAVAMAAALGAERCEIVKEVDGVCSADPRLVSQARPLRELSFDCLSEMCFWGAKVLHFRSVELAHHQKVKLVIKKWGSATDSTIVRDEVSGMESGKILSVNSLAKVEHIEIDAPDLNSAFETLGAHLDQHGLAWPQILASTYESPVARLMLTSDAESLEAMMRTLKSGIRRTRNTLSSVSLTCYGGVASDLGQHTLKRLKEAGIIAEKFILSPHSLTVFVDPSVREKTIQVLHPKG